MEYGDRGTDQHELCVQQLLYTQANVAVEVIFIGPLVARLCREYGLDERQERERNIGQIDANILRYGIPWMVVPGNIDDDAGMEALPAPPTFLPVPPH